MMLIKDLLFFVYIYAIMFLIVSFFITINIALTDSLDKLLFALCVQAKALIIALCLNRFLF